MVKRLLVFFLTLVLCLPVLSSVAENHILVRAGGSFGLALAADGSIWGWGDNASGQLGLKGKKKNLRPIPAASGIDGTHVVDIQCGNVSSLFLMDDGTVWTCGRNNYGQQGQDVAKGYVFEPIPIPGLSRITAVACGFGQCLALDEDGHVWAWGRNSNGQIGNGTRKSVTVPVMLEMENIVSIHCGGKYCLAMDAQGGLWGWGDNEYGQLLDASKWKNILVPTLLSASGRFVMVAAGGDTAYGLDHEGVLWAWGRNDYWQLGTRSVGKKTQEPVQVEFPESIRITRILAYNSHAGVITETGALWQWGSVYHGQLGNGKRPSRAIPTEASPVAQVLDADVGSIVSLCLLEDGRILGAGCNEYGQTGGLDHVTYYEPNWQDTGLNLLNPGP